MIKIICSIHFTLYQLAIFSKYAIAFIQLLKISIIFRFHIFHTAHLFLWRPITTSQWYKNNIGSITTKQKKWKRKLQKQKLYKNCAINALHANKSDSNGSWLIRWFMSISFCMKMMHQPIWIKFYGKSPRYFI